MALADAVRLRDLLGESIPPGGSEDDTLFTDAQIQDFLERASDNLDLAAYYGWEVKAAALANLATTKEGQGQENLSDLSKAAELRVKHFGLRAGVGGLTPRATRTRPIVRR